MNYDEIEDFDLFNFTFPCQSLSIAGKEEGMVDKNGSLTRSGLYTYGINIIKVKKPKYIMIENVKNLIGKKFIKDFYKIINQIEELGYNCYYPIKEDKRGNKKPICLNAKNYGIPQSRDRIFIICIRKNIDTYDFKFPIGKDYGIRLKDILEDNVDEKYYLSQKIQNRFKLNDIENKEYNEVNVIEKIFPNNERQVKINGEIYYNPQNKYYKRINSDTYLGYIGNQPKQATKVYDIGKESATLTANGGGQGGKTGLYHLGYAIRKLTPLECWRLMGFRDEDFYRAKESGTSNSQLYKQAGNSICVHVLYFIFKNLFKSYII